MKLLDLASLLAFYIVQHWWGLKPAIIVSVAVATAQGALKLIRRERPSTFFIFSAGMTVTFGLVDLWSTDPRLFRYEPAMTNLLTAIFFGATLFRGVPMIELLASARGPAKPPTPERRAFFRMLTWVWVGYFIAKSAGYAWVGAHYSLDEALAIRTVVGAGSLYGLIFLSVVGGRVVFRRFYLTPVISEK